MDGHRRSLRSTAAAGAGQHGSVDECGLLGDCASSLWKRLYSKKFKNVMELAYDFVVQSECPRMANLQVGVAAWPAFGRQNVGDSIGAAQPGYPSGFFQVRDQVFADSATAAGPGDKGRCG